MEVFMKASGNKIKWKMVLEKLSDLMAVFMKANGNKIKGMDLENKPKLMATIILSKIMAVFMKATGNKIKEKDKENLSKLMAIFMKVNGKKIKNKDMEYFFKIKKKRKNTMKDIGKKTSKKVFLELNIPTET